MTLRLHEPTFGEEETQAVIEVMRSTQVTQGEKVKAFEDAFAEKYGFNHVVACNSGSSANLLAISALKARGDLKDGDEVIVPALSWATTVFPIIQHNLIPVFVDCDINSLNLSVEGIFEAVGTKTKACMPVHVYGNVCGNDLPLLTNLDGLINIEDCCEAMGAMIGPYSVGYDADIATFSTYFSHHMTTLEGGLVACKDSDIAEMLRIQRSHGWTRDVDWDISGLDPKFTFIELGYNLRMTELQAAIGLVQLPKLGVMLDNRRKSHHILERELAHIPWLLFQKETVPNSSSSCFGFTMIVKDDAPHTVTTIRRQLEKFGIETRSIICGNMALQPVMKKYEHRCVGTLSNATKVMERGFSIGCHQDVTIENINRVVEAVESLVE